MGLFSPQAESRNLPRMQPVVFVTYWTCCDYADNSSQAPSISRRDSTRSIRAAAFSLSPSPSRSLRVFWIGKLPRHYETIVFVPGYSVPKTTKWLGDRNPYRS